MPKTICIIPCGKKKIWDLHPEAGPTEAQFAYIGTFASKCREYASKYYPDSWYILSAKYGFLRPTDIVPSQYDVSFNSSSPEIIPFERLIAQIEEIGIINIQSIVVLAGKKYIRVVSKVFPQAEIITPFKGRGIGDFLKWLNVENSKDIPIIRKND